MKLPIQPEKYNRTLEQQRSGELEREMQRVLAEISRLQSEIAALDARVTAWETP